MIKFIVGIIIGIGVAFAAAYLFATGGGINMATAGGPLPLEGRIAGRAIEASIGKSAHDESPVQADEINLTAGAQVYMHNCAGCHGRPDQTASGLGKRVYPNPPLLLLPGKGVTDDPVGATHWIVKNGIRFSAMPSYDGKLSETEIWQVSQFLHNADKLPSTAQDALKPTHSD